MDFRPMAEKNRILEIRVGSHLFGTNTPDSDLDLYGIFMPFDEIVFGSYRCEDVKFDKIDKDKTGRNTKDAVDRTLSEYRKFIKLALQNNPNILHVLFANQENVVFQNEFGKNLLGMAKRFPHKGAHHRFVKYAESQLHKMRIKPMNYNMLKNGLAVIENHDDHDVMMQVVDSEHNYVMQMGEMIDCAKQPFSMLGKGKHVKCGDLSFEKGIFVKKARRMIQDRLDNFTNRAEMYSKFGMDVKYASNLIQLLKEGIELMETGEIVFPLAYRQDIIDIKNGKYSADEIVSWSEDLIEDARVAYEKSGLPKNPRTKEIEEFAMQQVKEWVLNSNNRLG